MRFLSVQLKEETCFFAGDLMQVLKQLSSLPGGRSTARLGGPLFVERETPDYSLTVSLEMHLEHLVLMKCVVDTRLVVSLIHLGNAILTGKLF